jgi:hypothetical protein
MLPGKKTAPSPALQISMVEERLIPGAESLLGNGDRAVAAPAIGRPRKGYVGRLEDYASTLPKQYAYCTRHFPPHSTFKLMHLRLFRCLELLISHSLWPTQPAPRRLTARPRFLCLVRQIHSQNNCVICQWPLVLVMKYRAQMA